MMAFLSSTREILSAPRTPIAADLDAWNLFCSMSAASLDLFSIFHASHSVATAADIAADDARTAAVLSQDIFMVAQP